MRQRCAAGRDDVGGFRHSGAGTFSANAAQSVTPIDTLYPTYPFGSGTITRHYSITDVCGNSASCDQTIIVNDNVAPTAQCKPITLNFTGALLTIVPADVDNGSFDNCGGPVSLVSSVFPNTFGCANIGDNPVTLTVQDLSGNVNTCTAHVTIHDARVTPPLLVYVDAHYTGKPTCTMVNFPEQYGGIGSLFLSAAIMPSQRFRRQSMQSGRAERLMLRLERIRIPSPLRKL